MADNINITPGTGATVAADLIADALYQRIKLTLGNDGVDSGDVSSTNPMPVSSAPYAVKITEVGSITYVGKAPVGSSQASAVWQAMKIDETTGMVITWADGDSSFNNVATDLTTLSYS